MKTRLGKAFWLILAGVYGGIAFTAAIKHGYHGELAVAALTASLVLLIADSGNA